ncbi:unnamed protein product [Enterobius vermicularis]|uniref:Actin-interacting protein 1 n=1 Tax=Enterobius vermicularis TaxID=51028 RepID=A0A0N4VK05_ENTVE|nr:unnamed protein product [Enterobius vermicularis]
MNCFLGAVYASLPRTTRGLPLVINASPDGTKIVYCNGNSVFIRDIQDASKCEIYTEHAVLTTVAKYAPSGYYVASGDQSGKVRIWDATQPTHILKAEYPVISGPIRDVAWSEDSKRVAVVGEGRERFGHVFLFDTGTSNGNLSGQSRPMTSIDFRHARPYRIVSGSEDNTVGFFEGPPFKFKTVFREHGRFVHCVRYEPKGSMFASAGADGKVVLYEGAEGTKIGELVDSSCKGSVAHSGGVFGLCWSPEGDRIATASGDKSVKVWNVSSKELMKTFKFGNALEDQQLSVVWAKSQLFSISLAGFIYYLDVGKGSITKIIKGHFKPITAFALSEDRSTIFTADFEGNITRWSLPSGENERITPNVHKSQVSGMNLTASGSLISVGWDDTIAFTGGALNAIDGVRPNVTKLNSQPKGVTSSSDGGIVIVACNSGIDVFINQKEAALHKTSYEATCVSLCADKKYVVVGGQDCKVHVYELSGNNLKEIKVLPHASAITSVAFSPNGKYFVATDTARKVVPYAIADFKVLTKKDWTFHTARVNCAAWSQNSRYIATGGLDTNIIVWDLQNSEEHPIIIKGAHPMSTVNGIGWLTSNKIISIGQDSVLKTWTLKL